VCNSVNGSLILDSKILESLNMSLNSFLIEVYSVKFESQVYVSTQSHTTPILINLFTAICFGSKYEPYINTDTGEVLYLL
jgi:hypothetical protein